MNDDYLMMNAILRSDRFDGGQDLWLQGSHGSWQRGPDETAFRGASKFLEAPLFVQFIAGVLVPEAKLKQS